MGAHTGRCFRDRRRTKRRKDAQAARGYKAGIHDFRSTVADRMLGDMLHAMALRRTIQAR